MSKSIPIPRMTKKQMADAARQLDHLGMTAMWEENKCLRAALLKCREEFCWHGNTGKHLGADSYGELVGMIDKALGEETAE